MIDVGVMLPYLSTTTRDGVLDYIERAEELGFSGLSVGDRVVWHNLDQYVLLAAAAARTERVKISAQVTILPLHSPALAAKRAASLDILSGGRFRLGVGIGDREHDYIAAEIEMKRRYSRLTEMVVEMRRLWDGEPLSQGFEPLGPKPVSVPGPEIWTGGWGPKGLARAAAWADGYMGWTPNGARADLEAVRDTVAAAWAGAGREAPPMLTAVFFCLGDGADEKLRERILAYFGGGGEIEPPVDQIVSISNPDACRRVAENAEACGYEELTFIPAVDDASQLDLLAEALGR